MIGPIFEARGRRAADVLSPSDWRCPCLLGALLLVCEPQVRLADAREFRAADIQEDHYPTVQALRLFDRLVSQRTQGRHSIRVFHSRQLGEESQTIAQTRAGAIDINRINVATIGDSVPVLNVLALPFLFRSVEHLHKVTRRPHRR